MNKAKIEACEKLCREFLKRKKALYEKVDFYRAHSLCKDKPFEFFAYGLRESGALRRISMELTRALADLRRAG